MTSHTMVRPAFIAPILRKTIRTLEDLITMRNISTDYADTIDNHIDDVWERLMTRDNLVKAAKLDFLPMLEKYAQLNSEANLFRAYYIAGTGNSKEFYELAKQYIYLEPKLKILLSARFGDLDEIEKLLDRGDYLHTWLSLFGNIYEGKDEESVASGISLLCHWKAETDTEYKDLLDRALDSVSPRDEADLISIFEIDPAYTIDENRKQITTILNLEGGETLMAYACLSGNIELVKFLQSKGLELDEIIGDHSGILSCFHMAAFSDNMVLVHYVFIEMVKLNLTKAWIWMPSRAQFRNNGRYIQRFLSIEAIDDETDYSMEEDEIKFDSEDYQMFVELRKLMEPLRFCKFAFFFGSQAGYAVADDLLIEKYDDVGFVEGFHSFLEKEKDRISNRFRYKNISWMLQNQIRFGERTPPSENSDDDGSSGS